MKIQFAKQGDRKIRLMTAERTLFISLFGLALLITNFQPERTQQP